MTGTDQVVHALLRRDRLLTLLLLGTVFTASWAFVLSGVGMGASALEMTGTSRMGGMAMETQPWSPGYALVMFFMWWVMMIAMMLPGATPMILLVAAVNRRRRESGHAVVSTAVFTASYLTAWAGFSLGATLLHWAVAQAGLLGPGMVVSSTLLGGIILMAAGAYQLTPLKQACVRHCRMPARYLAHHWRPGLTGAIRLGMQHGAYCLGCCWLLMLLLFVGGVMNLYWIAGLALYVLLEKTLPRGRWLDFAIGALLTVSGSWLLVTVGSEPAVARL